MTYTIPEGSTKLEAARHFGARLKAARVRKQVGTRNGGRPMTGGKPVGHPVWDAGDGTCAYPDCGRRTKVYGGVLHHLRGSGGIPRTDPRNRRRPLRADEARRRVHSLTAEVAALRAEVEALREAAHPWVEVHRKLDELLARPNGRIVALDHRRIADGGRSRRDQLRDARRAG